MTSRSSYAWRHRHCAGRYLAVINESTGPHKRLSEPAGPSKRGTSKDPSSTLTDAGSAGLNDFQEELIVCGAACFQSALPVPHRDSGHAAIGSVGDQAEG